MTLFLGAYLLNKDFQIDSSLGFNHKNTPSNINISFGVSTRFDWYQDELPCWISNSSQSR